MTSLRLHLKEKDRNPGRIQHSAIQINSFVEIGKA